MPGVTGATRYSACGQEAGVTLQDSPLAEELLKQFSAHWMHEMRNAKPEHRQALNRILSHLKSRQPVTYPADAATEATAAEPSSVVALNNMAASALTPVTTPEKPRQDLEKFEVAGTGIPWNEFLERHARHAEDKKWLDIFKEKLREHLKGEDSQVLVNGQLAATVVRDGLFAYKKFEAENPHLAKQYTRYVTEEKLDVTALRQDHPALFDQYKATSVRIKK